MGAEKKAIAKVEAETRDEIDEIMNEIQVLQQEMSEAPKAAPEAVVPQAAAKSTPKLKAVKSPDPEPTRAAAPAPAVAKKPAPAAPVAKAKPEPAEPIMAQEDDLLGMDDFRGSGDEPSMEETLAGMKGDEETGNSLLDTPSYEDESAQDSKDSEDSEDQFDEIKDESETDQDSMENEVVVPRQPLKASPAPRASSNSSEGSLTMMLAGNMTLKLKYEFGDQEVSIGFENEALHVRLSNGTEFKIPVPSGKASHRKAS